MLICSFLEILTFENCFVLGEFIEYEVHTDSFFDLKLNGSDGKSLVCGVSMYLPASKWPEMNTYYTGLSWNNSVKVIDK